MAKISVYLTFGGNCREAMTCYRDILGGSLHLQTVGESPLAGRMPPQMQNLILHATLGGRANHPLEVTYWGALFGDLTDKFGNHWLLDFDQNVKQ